MALTSELGLSASYGVLKSTTFRKLELLVVYVAGRQTSFIEFCESHDTEAHSSRITASDAKVRVIMTSEVVNPSNEQLNFFWIDGFKNIYYFIEFKFDV
jgi:hypothetical protein